MLKRNENGAVDAMFIVALVLVVALGGFIYWQVTKTSDTVNDSADGGSSVPSDYETGEEPEAPPEESTDVDENEQGTKSSNEYFSIELPAGWAEDPDGSYAIKNEADFVYSNREGQKITVVVNVNPQGHGGDDAFGGYRYEINNDSIEFNEKIDFCPSDDPSGNCRYGDGKLFVVSIENGGEFSNGNRILFLFEDSKNETGEALKELTDIVKTLTVK